MNLIEQLAKEQIAKLTTERGVPDFQPGDTLRVHVKVTEGTRERIQAYEGVCVARKNAGVNSSFTVRKISHGEGVERVFQTFSPAISEISVDFPQPDGPITQMNSPSSIVKFTSPRACTRCGPPRWSTPLCSCPSLCGCGAAGSC